MGKILTLKKAVKKKVGEINTPNLPFIYPWYITKLVSGFKRKRIFWAQSEEG